MNLVIDIGNSFIKVAIFKEGELVFHMREKKIRVADIKKIHQKYPFKKSILSSVRIANPYFVRHLIANYKLIELDHKTKVPIKSKYGTPKTLGLDRLAAVIGAAKLYPGKNACVIDIGTCMTYDYIDADKVYWGGNIAPGVELRLRAMDEFTSALPTVKRKWNPEILGLSTKAAMQNGAVWGVKMEIERFIKTLTNKKGKMVVILTGGDAKYFGELVDSKIFVDSNLLLTGLNDILEYNS